MKQIQFFYTLIFNFFLLCSVGIKLYGAVLHVYEIVEPDDLARMLGHPVGTDERTSGTFSMLV